MIKLTLDFKVEEIDSAGAYKVVHASSLSAKSPVASPFYAEELSPYFREDDFQLFMVHFRSMVRSLEHLLLDFPKQASRPIVVCLCGSTRFKSDFEEAYRQETEKGMIVLTVARFGHLDGLDMGGPLKAQLDELHLRKIDLADEILVINKGGYIGEGTRREIEYARSKGKKIRMVFDSKAFIGEPKRCPEESEEGQCIRVEGHTGNHWRPSFYQMRCPEKWPWGYDLEKLRSSGSPGVCPGEKE